MLRISLLVIMYFMLNACGAPTKPAKDSKQRLIAALVSQNANQVMKHKSSANLSLKNQNIVNLYTLVINNQPYQWMSSSQSLIKNYHHYNQAQQNLLKPMLLWAYAHPIYRQETAKQVRLLQREELLVAPSHIDFMACEQQQKGCANTLRQQIAHMVKPGELTSTLLTMANNDPCINLTNENIGGDIGNQCLASRKGDLKVNLLSQPKFLYTQWEAILSN